MFPLARNEPRDRAISKDDDAAWCFTVLLCILTILDLLVGALTCTTSSAS
jgi:hypothetical protein